MITENLKTEIIRNTTYINDDILNEFNKDGDITSYIENGYITICYNDITKGYEGFKSRSFKIPKKCLNGISKSWFINQLNKMLDYQNINYSNLFKKLNLNTGNLYYTSYGFGYFIIGAGYFKDKFNKEIQNIKTFLDGLKIKYYTETSQGGWVYRFKISQNKDNLNKLRNLSLK